MISDPLKMNLTRFIEFSSVQNNVIFWGVPVITTVGSQKSVIVFPHFIWESGDI